MEYSKKEQLKIIYDDFIKSNDLNTIFIKVKFIHINQITTLYMNKTEILQSAIKNIYSHMNNDGICNYDKLSFEVISILGIHTDMLSDPDELNMINTLLLYNQDAINDTSCISDIACDISID